MSPWEGNPLKAISSAQTIYLPGEKFPLNIKKTISPDLSDGEFDIYFP